MISIAFSLVIRPAGNMRQTAAVTTNSANKSANSKHLQRDAVYKKINFRQNCSIGLFFVCIRNQNYVVQVIISEFALVDFVLMPFLHMLRQMKATIKGNESPSIALKIITMEEFVFS